MNAKRWMMTLCAVLLTLVGCGLDLKDHGSPAAKDGDDPQPDACAACANEENRCIKTCTKTWVDTIRECENDDCVIDANETCYECMDDCVAISDECMDAAKCPRACKGRDGGQDE